MAKRTRTIASGRRLRLWLRSRECDRALAAGADPNSDPLCRERARTLTSPRARTRIATALEGVIADAHRPRPPRRAAPVRWRAVRRAQPQLERLARRLREPDPVSPQGVARARLLVTDGTGPLYGISHEPGLWTAARSALVALDLGPELDRR